MNTEIPGIGQTATDFVSVDSQGKAFQLKPTLDCGLNILLLFYRGHW